MRYRIKAKDMQQRNFVVTVILVLSVTFVSAQDKFLPKTDASVLYRREISKPSQRIIKVLPACSIVKRALFSFLY